MADPIALFEFGGCQTSGGKAKNERHPDAPPQIPAQSSITLGLKVMRSNPRIVLTGMVSTNQPLADSTSAATTDSNTPDRVAITMISLR